MLDTFKTCVGVCSLSLPGGMQAPGIQGKLSHNSCLLELMASWLRGLQGPAFPGLGGIPVVWRDKAGICGLEELS